MQLGNQNPSEIDLELTDEDFLNCEREICKRSLGEFARRAWHVLEPAQKYVHGWHIDAICEHLEAVSNGQIRRLLINVPPGMMKSLLTCVFWPMWEWGPRGEPHTRIIGASYKEALALRDNMKCRRLVFSDWYQRLWPITLTNDQAAKGKFENTKTGFRQSMAAGSMVGERGDRVLIDDPHSVEGALSDVERESTLLWFRESVPTRLNNPDKSAIVVIMQRLHDRDVSGYIIKEKIGYEHLMLPMRFEKERRCSTSLGFQDQRTEEGELLFPERFPLSVVEEAEKPMGPAAVAGQFQQRPTPRGGLMFNISKLKIGEPPADLIEHTRFWDKAGTQDGGKRTAGLLMAFHEQTGIYWILHVRKGQWNAANREPVIRQTAESDGKSVRVWVEQEPGSGGKESAEYTVKGLAGWIIRAERPTGDKVLRAEPLSVQVERGNVMLAKGEWNQDFLDEAQLFPLGEFKDQIDAASGAFNKIALRVRVRIRSIGGGQAA